MGESLAAPQVFYEGREDLLERFEFVSWYRRYTDRTPKENATSITVYTMGVRMKVSSQAPSMAMAVL